MFRPADAVTALQPQDVNVFSPLKLRNALHLRMAMRVSNSERRRGDGRSGTHLMVQGYDWFFTLPPRPSRLSRKTAEGGTSMQRHS